MPLKLSLILSLSYIFFLNDFFLEPFRDPGPSGLTECSLVVDYRKVDPDALIDLVLFDGLGSNLIERSRFHLNDMMFIEPSARQDPSVGPSCDGLGYFNLGEITKR